MLSIMGFFRKLKEIKLHVDVKKKKLNIFMIDMYFITFLEKEK